MNKLVAFLIISVIFLSTLTGCYDANGIETLSFVVAIGLDKGTSNLLKLSVQIAIPKSSGESTSQSESESITTVECSSIVNGISLINSYISKKLNLSHCKIIVISETLSYSDIRETITTLINITEIRPDCNVLISRCAAEEYLKNSSNSLEKITARHYDLALSSQEYTGYTIETPITQFYSDLYDNAKEPIAVLGSINISSTHKKNDSFSLSSQANEDYKAGETPVNSETKIENVGLAVFKDFSLIGELNHLETICYLMVTSKLDYCTLSIPNPFDSDSNIDLYVSLKKNSKNDVKLVNGSPFISCKVQLEGIVLSSDPLGNFAKNEDLDLVGEYANSFLKSKISNYLYKTSKEFNSDINNFGKSLKTKYLTNDDWYKVNWLANYNNSFFNVEVDTSLRTGNLFSKN